MNRPMHRPAAARPDTHPWLRLLAAVAMTLALALPAFVVPAMIDGRDDDTTAGGLEADDAALDQAAGLATRDGARKRRPNPRRDDLASPETSL